MPRPDALPPHELAVRAAAALLTAAESTLTAVGLPAPRHKGMGSWWPLCSHSFLTVEELPYLPPQLEDTDRAGGVTVATVHMTELQLTVGRCRPTPTDACTWGEFMGTPVSCADPVPTPPDDTDCGTDGCSPYRSASDAWAAAAVDRHALIRGLRPQWVEAMNACGIGKACRHTLLASADPFQEGRFIGTRLVYSAQLA